MKKIAAFFLLNLLVLLVSAISHSELIDRGGGLIYNTDRNITWLQDANYAYTSGYDSDGLMNWADAMEWADSLEYDGYSDWRLPSPYNPDGSGPDDGFHVTGSEMGHLYYTELGNPYPGLLTCTGPFMNIQPNMYWTNTHHATLPDRAWSFSWVDGGTGHTNDWQDDQRAWAVRDGDVVPQPILLGWDLRNSQRTFRALHI